MTGAARTAVAAGAVAWLGAVAGWLMSGLAVGAFVLVALGVVAAVMTGRLPGVAIVVAIVGCGAALSGSAAAGRYASTLAAEVPAGRASVAGVVADEPVLVDDEMLVVVSPVRAAGGAPLPPLAIEWPGATEPRPGDVVTATGRLVPRSGTVRGDPVAGRLEARHAEIARRARGPFHRAAAAMRGRVTAVLGNDDDPAVALLAGFLIGDTSGMTRSELDELRAAGLSHFVAVSGSNVALFLGAWWLLLTPLAGPRVRAAVGLIGVVLFAVVTRWEPSVLRASAMVGLVLAGRLAGIAIDPIVALGWAGAALLLVAGDLAVSVGFQLSVAATVGVMVGTRFAASRRPRWVWSIVAATGGAQLAVAPIALYHFGSVPLMAPVANLLAAPLVTAATTMGGVATLLGGGPALAAAAYAARGVLEIAERAAGWPQLDAVGVVVVGSLLAAARVRLLRPVVLAAAAAGVALATLPAAAPPGASVTAMDIGQGDAIVVRDGDATLLVDGGRDPARLQAALQRNGVGSVDILVITHGDADHAAGLEGFLDRHRVGALWVPAFAVRGEYIDGIVRDAERHGVPVLEVEAGRTADVGRLVVKVLGPTRKYAADNDGAVVLWVEGGGATVLLPSDIEAVAQRELPAVRPDVLLVPHHGSATTDLRWLADTVGPLAVVSVGPNTYGHPSAEVLDALVDAGSVVRTTSDDGDIVVPLLTP